MNELTKYNFCSRIYLNNGVKFYDILTNGLVTIEEEDKITTDIVTLPEEMVYKVLQGRKYKIVNLKIDNDKRIFVTSSLWFTSDTIAKLKKGFSISLDVLI